jgi:transposase-like protein
MTISPAIKARVIELYLQKKGRNEIAREINISQGSVHNILRAYEDKSTAIAGNGHNKNHTQISATPVEDIHTESLSQESVINAYEQKYEQPLQAQSQIRSNTAPDKNITGSPTSMAQVHSGVGQANIVTPRDVNAAIQKHEPIDLQEIDFDDTPIEPDIFSDDVDYDEGCDGIKGERKFIYQYINTMNPYPNTTFPNTNILFPNNFNPYPNNFNQQISRPHVIEESKETSEEELDQGSNSLGMDWDENHESIFVKWVMHQKRIRQQEEHKLEEQWGLLLNERNSLEEQKRNIEAREAKISEVRDLIPSAQQLKEMGALFSQVQAFIYCVREKAASQMIDERTAAWNIVKDLELYNVIGGLQKAVAEKSTQLNLLSTTLEQQKSAIATLVHLQKIGITTTEIEQLVNLVGGWGGKNNGGNITANGLDSHLNLPNRHKEEIN